MENGITAKLDRNAGASESEERLEAGTGEIEQLKNSHLGKL